MRLPLRPTLRLLAALLLGSCTRSTVQVNLRQGDELKVQSVAIYPFTFRWAEPAYRSYELSEMMVLQSIATNRYAVFGPGEFKLIRATSDNPFVGSDLALGLADRGLSPTEAIVFRPSAERRAQSAVKELYDENGKPRGTQLVEEITVLARIEVFHSASRELIADVTARAEVDPFSARDPSDPLPELSLLLRKMMDALLVELATRAPGRLVERAPGFEYLWNPRQSLDFAMEGRPPLSKELKKVDALEQDIVVDARLRFFLPAADDTMLGRLKRMPGGLYVTKVVNPKSGLQTGDVITEVNGEAALPQSLHRQLRAADGKPVFLKVKRSSGMVELKLDLAP